MKKFLIIAPINSLTCNSTFEYIRTGKIRCGSKYNSDGGLSFNNDKNENVVGVPANYITNLKYDFTKPNLNLTKTYNPEEYPKYDNYDVIEVSKTKNIPMDYTGQMGVPINFLDKYNPEQFQIICSIIPVINGKGKFQRLIIRNKHPVSTENTVNNNVDE